MTLEKMAEEYRESAARLRDRAIELEAILATEKMCEMERLRVRRRVLAMRSAYREMRSTAAYLEAYYERGNLWER